MRRIRLLPALVIGASGEHARTEAHPVEAAGVVNYVDGSAAESVDRSFQLGPKLGSGRFGAVFRTDFQGANVAVKISHRGTPSWSDVRGAINPLRSARGGVGDRQCNANVLITLFRATATECEAMSHLGDGEQYIAKCLGHNSSPPMLAALAKAQRVLPEDGAMDGHVPSPFVLPAKKGRRLKRASLFLRRCLGKRTMTPGMAVPLHVVTTETIFPLLISELGRCDGAAALRVADPQESLFMAVHFSLLRSELAALTELCSRRKPAWSIDTKPENQLVFFDGATDPVDAGLAVKISDLGRLVSPSHVHFREYAQQVRMDLTCLQYGRSELVDDLTSQLAWQVLIDFPHHRPSDGMPERVRDALKSLRAWASEKIAQFTTTARAELSDPLLTVAGEVSARLADDDYAARRAKPYLARGPTDLG